MRQFDVITFDCYGTLIDWRSGIAEAFERTAAADGVQVEVSALLDAYDAIEPKVEHERYRSYREVLAETAARAAHSLGWTIDYARAGFLAGSLPLWRPFDDTNAALERLVAAGHILGILSNVDDDLIAATRRHFTVDFDFVITAQQVRAYKPALKHFLAARDRVAGARWLHAAQSDYHDIVPTNTIGVPNAWINRLGERALPGGVPTFELRDMASFAALMT
jgi:2-haloacid dehalogenase/putative hydrolase of the HAD superfamily